ncbi:MAG: MCE family protein [Chitinophagaceae bacterium]|nr:MCE family protein [Chitinophagaceae bacterium]
METQKNRNAVITGIFVTIGIVIFIVGIFTLGGQQKTFVKSINVFAVFDDVSGLQQGNNIWFSGVKIGIVKKIAFYNNSQVKVTLHIEEKAREFIRTDAKAKIGSDGLIGNKIIVIYGGTQKAPAIEGGENLAVEKTTSTDDMFATLQESNMNLIDITRNIKAVSKQLVDGQGTVAALLNERTMYNELNSVIATLKRAVNNSEKLTSGIAAYSARLQTPGTLASDLVSDTTIIPNLRETSNQIHMASEAIVALSDNIKDASRALGDSGNIVGVLLRDEKTANNLKATLENLNSVSKKLDEDLEALQHNFLLRGFFRKKAKREAKAAEDSIKANQ